MSSEKLLSICIPTRNRVSYLRELVPELLRQIGSRDDIEIVISDNASTDETYAYLRSIEDERVMAVHQDHDIGERNFVEVTRYANGEYVWFLGDDDTPHPAAVDTLAWTVSGGVYDWFVFDCMQHDKINGTITPVRWLKEGSKVSFYTSDDMELLELINSCRVIGSLGGLISTVVAKRSVFLESLKGMPSHMPFPLVYTLLNSCSDLLMSEFQLVTYNIKEGYVGNHDVWARTLLDVSGWCNLCSSPAIEAEDVREALCALFRRTHGAMLLITLRRFCGVEARWHSVRPLLAGLGYSKEALDLAEMIAVQA